MGGEMDLQEMIRRHLEQFPLAERLKEARKILAEIRRAQFVAHSGGKSDVIDRSIENHLKSPELRKSKRLIDQTKKARAEAERINPYSPIRKLLIGFAVSGLLSYCAPRFVDSFFIAKQLKSTILEKRYHKEPRPPAFTRTA